MPKKFQGENTKSAAARARKAEAKAAADAKRQQELEDAYWKDEDKHVMRKEQRKVSSWLLPAQPPPRDPGLLREASFLLAGAVAGSEPRPVLGVQTEQLQRAAPPGAKSSREWEQAPTPACD